MTSEPQASPSTPNVPTPTLRTSRRRQAPDPPTRLPEARRLRGPQGVELVEFSLRLCSTTPILGGSYRTRHSDDVDYVRAPTIRGHLRFWWRALYGQSFARPSELFAAEGGLWGRSAGQKGERSLVEVRVEASPGDGNAHVEQSAMGPGSPGFYALWPARAEKNGDVPAAPFRSPGFEFTLFVRCPKAREVEVRNALRAWVLFGGYGGRTRRGVGSLTVISATQEGAPSAIEQWLPTAATREELTRLFGQDIFALPSLDPKGPRAEAKAGGASDVPRLAGAALYIKKAPTSKATDAWLGALGWLREFRQGPDGQPARAQGAGKAYAGSPRGAPPVVGVVPTSMLARHPGKGNRPGISNWPEPDKIRRLSPGAIDEWAHSPERHNGVAAWPRAGFGLPIIGKFQQKDRDNRLWRERGKREPPDFQLLWQRGETKHDRLASPLIVKALPLTGGRFVSCALWLERGYPEGGRVYLYQGSGQRPVPRSDAPFERITAPGDEPQFDALKGKSSLRQAFLDWLKSAGKCDAKVAP